MKTKIKRICLEPTLVKLRHTCSRILNFFFIVPVVNKHKERDKLENSLMVLSSSVTKNYSPPNIKFCASLTGITVNSGIS